MRAVEIAVEGLSVTLGGQKILENVTFNLYEHDFLAIIGPNGGGKSTLLRALLGLVPFQEGSVRLFGTEQIRPEQIGYVPQNTNVNLDFPITVIDVVLSGATRKRALSCKYSKAQKEHAVALLAQVGMQGHEHKKIGSLSGGQRQRVFIARALMSGPKLLVLDEPTASIDVKGQYEIYELLKRLNATMSILVVSHNLSIALDYAKNIAHVNRRLVYHEAPHIDTSDIAKRVGTTNEHICEVEILNILGHSSCDHPEHHHD